MNISTRFIIIDDDEINNMICSVTLKKLSADIHLKTFIDPAAALEYITEEYSNPAEAHDTILFLDISMPLMNGWEFLERYELFSQAIKDRIKIYILSSSDDRRDLDKAKENKNVVSYLVKPLTRETVRQVVEAQGLI
jgi:two-component SAPR family response regulator